MKILRIVTRLNVGGPTVHVLLSSRLDARRFSTCLVAGRPEPDEGDLSASPEAAETRLIRVDALSRRIRPGADLLALARLLHIIAQERPDVIHTHMAKAGCLGRLAGLLSRHAGGARPLLVHTFHGHVLDGYFPVWGSRLFATIERWLARRTDCLVAVSPTVRDELLARGIGRTEQWRVVPLGLDLAGLASLAPRPDDGQIHVGMVGRLVPIKNPALFLEALAIVKRQGEGTPLTALMVGDGPLRVGLERRTQQLGLEGAVRFTGWRRDLPRIYAELDVVCLSSWNEGTPVALIEALAAGRTVISTDVGGVLDVLDEGDRPRPEAPRGGFRIAARGVLVRAGDARGLAAALRAVAADRELRRRLGEAGRAHVLREYGQERMLANLAALYEELSGRRGG